MVSRRIQKKDQNKPYFIGPGQRPVRVPSKLKLAKYYASTPQVVFDKRLNQADLAKIPYQYLPLAVSSRNAVSERALKKMQGAIRQMANGKWDSVYVPTKPGDGNNSGNGMTGIFLQRADLEVIVELDHSQQLKTRYLWPRIRQYQSRHRIQPQNFNYSLVYHHYRSAFEAAFDLMISSICLLDKKLQRRMVERRRLGLYFGITDYYGSPEVLPSHLLQQALQNNPNPDEVSKNEYLDMLHGYYEKPLLPGNYHTDGIEKLLDVQGIFTILNQDCVGGETLIRRRGIPRNKDQRVNGKTVFDIATRLTTAEGHAGLWVPSWGRTEVEHTPGPIQGGHRTIIVFGLDSIDPDLEIEETEIRKYYGSHYETRSWDKRSWYRGENPIETPDRRLWRAI